MATPAYYISAFAAEDQREIPRTATTSYTGVFAQRERRSLTEVPLAPQQISVRLYVGAEPITLTYNTVESSLPAWSDAVLQSLSERWGVEPGWDTYDARPTNPAQVVTLLNLLSELLPNSPSRTPIITALSDGGVQAEWHVHGRDLEIVVAADTSPSYFFYDRATEEEEEAPIHPNYERLRSLIDRLF